MVNQRRVFAVLLTVLMLLGGCGSAEEAAAAPAAAPAAKEYPETVYQAPEISETAFHRDRAVGDGNAAIDTSAVSEGYVAVSARSDSRLKFQVVMGDAVYTYDLPNDGEETIFCLQSGDGLYTFKIMENVVDTRYMEMFSTEADVKLKDEFQPFLRTNQYASYHKGSACVKKAEELASVSANQLEVIGNIFSFICGSITYDKDKAETVQSGYIPMPDETLAQGRGICFDYASLAASMLRSQGIPTKIIFGYVSPGELYHAWNMFYTDETGWITVEYEVSAGAWNRIDCTFSANGADPKTTGDGTGYTDVYVY